MNSEYVVGIDGGLVTTGVCILEYKNGKFTLIFTKDISTSPKKPLEERLYFIYKNISDILEKFPQIKIMGLEETYVNMNAKSSLKLGMVTGIILSLSVKYNIKIKFMSPTHIKKNITGFGHGSKELIYTFVSRIVEVPDNLSHHLYDAIAIGILAI
jgi:crossover junction endodeoxyribonuclease RuvC